MATTWPPWVPRFWRSDSADDGEYELFALRERHIDNQASAVEMFTQPISSRSMKKVSERS